MMVLKKIISYPGYRENVNNYVSNKRNFNKNDSNIFRYNIIGCMMTHGKTIKQGFFTHKGECYKLPNIINSEDFNYEKYALNSKSLELKVKTLGKYKVTGYFKDGYIGYGLLEYDNKFYQINEPFQLSETSCKEYISQQKLEPEKMRIGNYDVAGFFQNNYVVSGTVKYKNSIYLLPATFKLDINSIEKYISDESPLYTAENEITDKKKIYSLKKMFPKMTTKKIESKDIKKIYEKLGEMSIYPAFKNNPIIKEYFNSSNDNDKSLVDSTLQLFKQIDDKIDLMNEDQLKEFKVLFNVAFSNLKCFPDIYSNLGALAVKATLMTSLPDNKSYSPATLYVINKILEKRPEIIARVNGYVNNFFNGASDSQETHQNIFINYILDKHFGINCGMSKEDHYVTDNEIMDYIVIQIAYDILSVESMAADMRKEIGNRGDVLSLPFMQSFFRLQGIDPLDLDEKNPNSFIGTDYSLTDLGVRILLMAALKDTESKEISVPEINHKKQKFADECLKIMKKEATSFKSDVTDFVTKEQKVKYFFRLFVKLKAAALSRVKLDKYFKHFNSLDFNSKLESLYLLCNNYSKEEITNSIQSSKEVEAVLKYINTALKNNKESMANWMKEKGHKISVMLNMCSDEVKKTLLCDWEGIGKSILQYQRGQFFEILNDYSKEELLSMLESTYVSSTGFSCHNYIAIALQSSDVFAEIASKLDKEQILPMLTRNKQLLLKDLVGKKGDAVVKILSKFDTAKVLTFLKCYNNKLMKLLAKNNGVGLAKILSVMDNETIKAILDNNIIGLLANKQPQGLVDIYKKLDQDYAVSFFKIVDQNIYWRIFQNTGYSFAELIEGREEEIVKNILQRERDLICVKTNKTLLPSMIDDNCQAFVSILSKVKSSLIKKTLKKEFNGSNIANELAENHSNMFAEILTCMDKKDMLEILALPLQSSGSSKLTSVLSHMSTDDLSNFFMNLNLSDQEFLKFLNMPVDDNGNTLLSDILDNKNRVWEIIQVSSHSPETILSLLSQNIKGYRKNGNLAGFLAVYHKELLVYMLKELTPSHRMAILKLKSLVNDDNIGCYLSRLRVECFEEIVEDFYGDEIAELLKIESLASALAENGSRVLVDKLLKLGQELNWELYWKKVQHILKSSPSSIRADAPLSILSKGHGEELARLLMEFKFDKKSFIDFLKTEVDYHHHTVLTNMANDHSQALQRLLDQFVPDKNSIASILETEVINYDQSKSTIAGILSENSCDVLVDILSDLDDDLIIQILNIESGLGGIKVIDKILKNNKTEIFRLLIPKDKKFMLKFLDISPKLSDTSMATIMAERYSEQLFEILQHQAKEEKYVEAMLKKDFDGQGSFAATLAANNMSDFFKISGLLDCEKALEIIKMLVPGDKEIFSLLQTSLGDSEDNNLAVSLAVYNEKLLVYMLKTLPHSQRMEILGLKVPGNNRSIDRSIGLYLSMYKVKSFEDMVSYFKPNEIEEFLKLEYVAYAFAKSDSRAFADTLLKLDQKTAISILNLATSNKSKLKPVSVLSKGNGEELARILMNFEFNEKSFIDFLNIKVDKKGHTVLTNMANYHSQALQQLLKRFVPDKNSIVSILNSKVDDTSGKQVTYENTVAGIMSNESFDVLVDILSGLDDDSIIQVLDKEIDEGKIKVIDLIFWRKKTETFKLLELKGKGFMLKFLGISLKSNGKPLANIMAEKYSKKLFDILQKQDEEYVAAMLKEDFDGQGSFARFLVLKKSRAFIKILNKCDYKEKLEILSFNIHSDKTIAEHISRFKDKMAFIFTVQEGVKIISEPTSRKNTKTIYMYLTSLISNPQLLVGICNKVKYESKIQKMMNFKISGKPKIIDQFLSSNNLSRFMFFLTELAENNIELVKSILNIDFNKDGQSIKVASFLNDKKYLSLMSPKISNAVTRIANSAIEENMNDDNIDSDDDDDDDDNLDDDNLIDEMLDLIDDFDIDGLEFDQEL
ncbi:MAG: hypothetical protein GY730_06830 [bacterium]|nr:hypothetical protein [bacterium]